MVGVRMLHVYAHLLFRAWLFDYFDLLHDEEKFWECNMMASVLCVHLTFYELDLIG